MAWFKPRSKRIAPPHDIFRYDLPGNVRNRILYGLDSHISTAFNRAYNLGEVVERAFRLMFEAFGSLPEYTSRDPHDINYMFGYFCNCPDETALDLLEAIFRIEPTMLDNEAVSRVNEILLEDGVGYELTPIRRLDLGMQQMAYPPVMARQIDYEYPQVIRKDEEYLHAQVVKPCLSALARPEFKIALDEMMAAHEDHRHGRNAGAITNASSAFESVLKTICTAKGWAFDPDKNACAKLVGVCKDNGLFPGFYAPMLEAVGSVRNKLGDAHGRGPAPPFVPSKEHADHMIQTTSAHITILVKLADL